MDGKSQGAEPKDAEPTVRAAHRQVEAVLPFSDRSTFADAKRGFIGTLPDALVLGGTGQPVWNLKNYRFLEKDHAPATVNPSLWRMAQLNLHHGLFKVVDGIYQIRGFDLANLTIVEGQTGLIVIDPLLTEETARAALELYFTHRPRRPVVAVIYSHSHVDHWGGVKGVLAEDEVKAGRAAVIAPAGFMDALLPEDILVSAANRRRGQYQFGYFLPKGERGQVDAGLGKSISFGRITLIAPTDTVATNLDRRTIDGVEIVFQLAPNSEAPAEFHLYFPQFRALNLAENATHTFHNLLPFRGAEVRDARAWSRHLDDALLQFGEEAEVLLGQHHWPVWGRQNLQKHLRQQRDLYKFIHDQTIRLMNRGYTATEIAETLRLPASLAEVWHIRGYYGSLSHNVKAIYQKYLGWYDANPANLNPLPPVESGRKFVDYMGGSAAVLTRARGDFQQGNYRWVTQVLSHVVFAEPGNRAARELAADAFEQLGYTAEAATWRNAYLMAAWELRNGVPDVPARPPVAPDALRALSTEALFDYLGVGVNGRLAEGKKIVLDVTFTDSNQSHILNLENAALTHQKSRGTAVVDATLTLARETLDAIALRQTTFPAAVQAGLIRLEGNGQKAAELFGLIEHASSQFAIVEPKKGAP